MGSMPDERLPLKASYLLDSPRPSGSMKVLPASAFVFGGGGPPPQFFSSYFSFPSPSGTARYQKREGVGSRGPRGAH